MSDYKDLKFEPSCPGERWKIELEPIVQADGTIELRESGKTDLQEFYDSQAASCDMALIISRYLNGDRSVLEQRQGAYFDATQVPSTYAEMLQTVISGQRSFEALPVEVKQRFNNDFNQWFASAGSEDWQSKMTVSGPVKVESDIVAAQKAPDPVTE